MRFIVCHHKLQCKFLLFAAHLTTVASYATVGSNDTGRRMGHFIRLDIKQIVAS